jgi:predicted nucleic acid-binding protein
VTLPTPSNPTVSNTSCLIALEGIGRLHLLEQLYQQLVIPGAVAREWGIAIPSWMTIQPVQNQPLIHALHLQVGLGEAEAIALALETAATRLILDDLRARRVAASFSIPVTGTVGVVLRAKQQGLVPLVRPVFDDLQAAGFWISGALLQQALQLAGE